MRFDRTTYGAEGSENADCSVRALMVVSGLSYEESLEVFRKHGRHENTGTPHEVTQRVVRDMFPEAFELDMSVDRLMGTIGKPCLKVTEFAKMFGRGRFIVHVKGHALALVDGTIHDWRFRPATRVTAAWKVSE